MGAESIAGFVQPLSQVVTTGSRRVVTGIRRATNRRLGERRTVLSAVQVLVYDLAALLIAATGLAALGLLVVLVGAGSAAKLTLAVTVLSALSWGAGGVALATRLRSQVRAERSRDIESLLATMDAARVMTQSLVASVGRKPPTQAAAGTPILPGSHVTSSEDTAEPGGAAQALLFVEVLKYAELLHREVDALVIEIGDHRQEERLRRIADQTVEKMMAAAGRLAESVEPRSAAK